MNPLESTEGGIRLRLRIQPRASRTEVAGLHGDTIRIRLSAPPVDGAANEELIRFLATRLGVPVRAVEITAGHGGRQKTVHVRGVGRAEAAEALGLLPL
ncbi:MAG: YggU family protein [Gemmatimonadales bacterium]|jgi:uncharacterized protein (TIGR00251 family)|nr:MAG: YggU family protein [Gemmatimonadales bacterium]